MALRSFIARLNSKSPENPGARGGLKRNNALTIRAGFPYSPESSLAFPIPMFPARLSSFRKLCLWCPRPVVYAAPVSLASSSLSVLPSAVFHASSALIDVPVTNAAA